MNRIDELSGLLVDDVLGDVESVELNALLSTDQDFQRRLDVMIDLEVALRGLRADTDLPERTIARIQAERAERTVANVMSRLVRPTRARRFAPWLIGLAVIVAISVILLRPAKQETSENDVSLKITNVTGAVEVMDPNGELTASNQSLRIGQTLRTVGEDSSAVIEFPDRSRIELSPDSLVRLISSERGRKIELIHGHMTANLSGVDTRIISGASELRSEQGTFSVSSSSPESMLVESIRGEVQIIRGNNPTVVTPGKSTYFRDDHEPMIMRTSDQKVREPVAQLDFPGAFQVVFPKDSSEIWAVSAKQLVRWDVANNRNTRILWTPVVKNDGNFAIPTPDCRWLLTPRFEDREERLAVREFPSGVIRTTIPVRVTESRFACIAPDGSWVATVTERRNRITIWDTTTGAVRTTFPLETSTGKIIATPDGKYLVADHTDLSRDKKNKIVFFDINTGTPTIELPSALRICISMKFSDDGRYLAAGFNGCLQVWDHSKRELVKSFEGFERPISAIAWSRDGQQIAAGTNDGLVWIWSMADGQRRLSLTAGSRGVRDVAFSPDGRKLVTAANKSPVMLWDIPQ